MFQSFQTEGYRLKYFRIPISPEQAPEDNYFDEYINVIRNLEPTDPLIFNCGIGAVRSKFLLNRRRLCLSYTDVQLFFIATVGIIIAQIIRRTQLIERGRPDPFPVSGWGYPTTMDASSPVMSDELNMNRFVKGLEEADNVNAKNHALLRLVLILENGKQSRDSFPPVYICMLTSSNSIGL